jgi:hypothetical protein
MTKKKPLHHPTIRQEREVITENERLSIYRDRIVTHTGRERIHWKVSYAREGVGVIPILEDHRVLLGLHYRYCTEKWGWEIVAGSVEPSGSA